MVISTVGRAAYREGGAEPNVKARSIDGTVAPVRGCHPNPEAVKEAQ
jgi:hypothetical protein